MEQIDQYMSKNVLKDYDINNFLQRMDMDGLFTPENNYEKEERIEILNPDDKRKARRTMAQLD